MTIGRPRPLPGYPTTLALYPISVRRVRVQGHRLPSDPTSRWAPLPSLAVPVITARGGLAPLTSPTCLAHKAGGPPATSRRSGPGTPALVIESSQKRGAGDCRRPDPSSPQARTHLTRPGCELVEKRSHPDQFLTKSSLA